MNIQKLIAFMLLFSCLVLSFVSCKGKEDPSTSDGDDNGDENVSTPFIPDPITYEEYEAMTPEERSNYYDAFENYEDFFAWYNAAKEKYDEDHKLPEIGEDGEIDIGDIIGGQ